MLVNSIFSADKSSHVLLLNKSTVFVWFKSNIAIGKGIIPWFNVIEWIEEHMVIQVDGKTTY